MKTYLSLLKSPFRVLRNSPPRPRRSSTLLRSGNATTARSALPCSAQRGRSASWRFITTWGINDLRRRVTEQWKKEMCCLAVSDLTNHFYNYYITIPLLYSCVWINIVFWWILIIKMGNVPSCGALGPPFPTWHSWKPWAGLTPG
jgi:hypothetical protein